MNEHLDIATVALAMTVIEWLKAQDDIWHVQVNEVTQHPPHTKEESNEISKKPAVASP
jgi:hypothetical protein